MTMTVQGVPEKILWSEMADWLAKIGLTAEDIPRCSTMEFGRGCITVEVFARDLDGKIMFDGEKVGRHRVTIPIVDDPA